jgi:hypothetical protein
MTGAVYYRFEDKLVGSGGFDIYGDYVPGPSYVKVEIVTFEVDRLTPKGAWVWLPTRGSYMPMTRRFVCNGWYNKYANPTIEGARADFIARKKRLIAIQTRRVRDAQEAIDLAEANRERSLYRASIKAPA